MKKKALYYSIVILSLTLLLFALSYVFYILILDTKYMSEETERYFASALVDSEAVNMIIGFGVTLLFSLLVLIVAAAFMLRPLAKYEKKARAERAKKKKKGKNREETGGGARFPQLLAIDKALDKGKKEVEQYDTCSLSVLCESFRNFAAGKLGLYYDIADIRRFIAGMGISRLMILRGMSGTGKTSLAYAAGEFFANPSTVVPIQPMWKERSDMIGYFNEFTKKFSETRMLGALYEAGGRRDIYITVLDEVNISRIEYYFAEFLSLLELPDPKRRYLDVVSDSWESDPERLSDGKLLLPVNMWFVGTANNDDSTFAISDKVYDRACVIDLERKCTPFECTPPPACRMEYSELERLFSEACAEYTLSSEAREKLAELDAYMTEVFRVSFGNRIMRQIERYVPIMLACGGTEAGALDDILARKILRKLEALSPAFVKSEADGLISKIEECFGAGVMLLSAEYIGRLEKGY